MLVEPKKPANTFPPNCRSRHPLRAMGKAKGATPEVHSLKESPGRRAFWNGGSLSVASSNARERRWCERPRRFPERCVGANGGDGGDGRECINGMTTRAEEWSCCSWARLGAFSDGEV